MSRDIIRTPVIRRTLVASAATVATALILTPASAHAAGGGPGGGKPAPHPAGPVQTTTKIVPPKMLVSTKALTISAHVSPARRGFGTPAESGTVVFTVDGAAGSPLKLAASKASEKVKFTAGKHAISAKYSGDAAHAGSDSGEVSITVS